YGSAEALAEDLERWLARKPIQARRSSTWERSLKWARRRPAVAALAAVGTAAVFTLIGLMGALWRNAEARATAVQQLQTARDLLGTLEKESQEKQEEARTAQVAMRRALYIRDISLVPLTLEKEQRGYLAALLERHRPQPGQEDVRDFEWHYLWRLCHS